MSNALIIIACKLCAILVIILANKATKVYSIWPPPYEINLTQGETFVISDLIDDSDVQDVYDEEELLKKEDMEQMKLLKQPDKYYRLHHSLHGNENAEQLGGNEEFEKKNKVIQEFNPDREEPLPRMAGFVDEEGNFMKDRGIIYFGEDENNINERNKEKRDDKQDTNKDENYDYSQFKAEYSKEVEKAKKSKETLNYTNVKEDESLKDSVKALVPFTKTPRNCSEEEIKGIGFAAVECFWLELNKPKMRSHVLEKMIRIVIIWFIVYLVIAIPLWCHYGWCCCCCPFKFCRPKEEMDEVKKYFAENPVGVCHDKDGNIIKYQPTYYEKYAQRQLEDELKRLA